MSFLRKQESRLILAQAGTEGIWTSAFFLDSRFRRNDTPASLAGTGLSTAGGETGV